MSPAKDVSRREVHSQETVHQSEISIIREFARREETGTWDSKPDISAKVCEVRSKAGTATPAQTSASTAGPGERCLPGMETPLPQPAAAWRQVHGTHRRTLPGGGSQARQKQLLLRMSERVRPTVLFQ